MQTDLFLIPPVFNRVWAMPDSNTFNIVAIKQLINRHFNSRIRSIDPFSNINRYASITNDIDPDCKANYCMDALEFLKMFKDGEVDFVFYDPPYSSRQVSESYKKMGMSVNMETTQGSYWSNQKDEIKRITHISSTVISFGWSTNGMGKKRGFDIVEILLVAHGGAHNDTLCTVEKKVR